MLKGFLGNKKAVIIAATVIAIVMTATIIIAVFTPRGGKDDNPVMPTNVNVAVPEDDSVTRAEWIKMLTDVMGYDKSNDAEAYFTDVSAGNADYDSIQIAVAYNLISTDIDSFKPDDKATREFVAVTAVKAVGFFGTPSAVINDIAVSSDPDSIRLAVDNNIFVCPDGKFNPNGELTAAECNTIINKIKTITTATIDPNHEDTIVFADGVIDLSESTNPISHYADATIVQMTKEDGQTLSVGSIYILPPSEQYPYGVARKAKEITVSLDGNSYVIESEEPRIEEVIASIDIQGVYAPDFSNVIWAEGVTGGFGFSENMSQTMPFSDISIQHMNLQSDNIQIQPMVNYEDSLSYNEPFWFSVKTDKVKVNGSGKIFLRTSAMIYADFKIDTDPNEAIKIHRGYVLFEKAISSSTNCEITELEKKIPLCKIPITPGGAAFGLSVDLLLNTSGEISASYSMNTRTDFGIDVIENSPRVFGDTSGTHDMDIAASVNLMFQVQPKIQILNFKLIEATAEIGASIKATLIDPCKNVDMYMPFSLEVEVFPSLPVRPYVGLDIFTEENSPIRSRRHFENGKVVDACTKTDKPSPPDDVSESTAPSALTVSAFEEIELTGTIIVDNGFVFQRFPDESKAIILKLESPELLTISEDSSGRTTENINEIYIFAGGDMAGAQWTDIQNQLNSLQQGDRAVVTGSISYNDNWWAQVRPIAMAVETVTKADSHSQDLTIASSDQALLDQIKSAFIANDMIALRTIMSSPEFAEIINEYINSISSPDAYTPYLDKEEKLFTNINFDGQSHYIYWCTIMFNFEDGSNNYSTATYRPNEFLEEPYFEYENLRARGVNGERDVLGVGAWEKTKGSNEWIETAPYQY